MDQTETQQTDKITKNLIPVDNPKKLLLIVITTAVLLGIVTGFILSKKGATSLTTAGIPGTPPKNAQSDTKTFKDFAEGVIQPNPQASSGDYTEGAYLLKRENAVPVALTSSVVDLSQYTGKKVKVYGETQKALKAGWLMDVGKVEVEQ